jgi:hypothetical protein
MTDSRHRHGSRLHFTVRTNKLFNRPKPAASKFARHGISLCDVSINHPNQSHRLALLRKLVIDTGMIAPKRPHPDNRNIYKIISGQFYFPVCELNANSI